MKLINDLKRCSKRNKCLNENKIDGGFLPINCFTINRSNKDGLRNQCSVCANNQNSLWRKNNPEKNKITKDAYRLANKDKKRNWELKHRYGITLQDYEELLNKQGGICKICGNPPKKNRLAVDHNHVTGKVRGLLCHTCNKILGLMKTDYLGATILKAAVNYIELSQN